MQVGVTPAAMYFENSSPIINKATITNNNCGFFHKNINKNNIKVNEPNPSGIEITGNSNPKIINSIIWNNYPNEISGNLKAYYSDILNGWREKEL